MRNIPKFYVISYPESYWLIPTYIHQFNKYIPDAECVIMCYEYPELDDVIPDNFKIISLTNGKPQGGAVNWASSIRKYLETVDDEYIIFSLDDYLISDKLSKSFESEMKKVHEYDIKRYVLGATSGLYNLEEWNGLLKFKETSEYRISCQVSVWNRKYLLKYLKDGWNPWDFEIKGSVESQNLDDILVYSKSPVLRCIYNGAVSRRYNGRINVLGLRVEDINYHAIHGDFKDKKLQYGTLTTPKLFFENVEKFNINLLRPHMPQSRFKDYVSYYGEMY